MLFFPSHRSRYRSLARSAILYIGLFILLDLLLISRRYKTFSRNLQANTVRRLADLPASVQNEKIYICAQFWTSADVLAEFWIERFLDLVNTLGSEHIYVSILESGSMDNTKEMLSYLDYKLGELNVERSIVLDPTTHEDVVSVEYVKDNGEEIPGWIYTGDSDPPGRKELRRIPYLAELRNRGLEPLLTMAREEGRRFNKILYLNDVDFQPPDVLSLLATNSGFFDVACALDFHILPGVYDVFALRDSQGRGPVINHYPYFGAIDSRSALLQGRPAPVSSCWNGMLVVDAAPYYDRTSTTDTTHTRERGLRFRGIDDALAAQHVEASECCLIHADLKATGQAKKGIYVNPAVRVGYTHSAYQETHRGSTNRYLSFTQYVHSTWLSRLARWKVEGFCSAAGQGLDRIALVYDWWQTEGAKIGETRTEPGEYCTINEMQILIWRGWKHVW